MGKPFVALYKAFTGGEWFRPSLDSIREHTDGAAVVFTDAPWKADLPLTNNCREPLQEFMADNPKYPIRQMTGAYTDQADQYRDGLALVREHWGPDAAVLVIDTDEIWEADQLRELRRAIDEHPECHYFRSSIFTYLKSPLYRVWPQEGANVCVGLQDCREQPTRGRFSVTGKPSVAFPRIAFHHFPYVRTVPHEVVKKFELTSSQESTPSKADWFQSVWPKLPDGQDLHMTPGCESCWGEIQLVTPLTWPEGVDDLPFVWETVLREEIAWRQKLRETPPDQAIIPVPTDHDRQKYFDTLRNIFIPGRDLPELEKRLKQTYYETVWLACQAAALEKNSSILEIGCGSGGSTACMALASDSSVTIVTVDPFAPYNEVTHAGIVSGVTEGNEDEFWAAAYHYGYRGRVSHQRHDSTGIAWKRIILDVTASQQRGYQLALVDGNHSEPYAASDIALVWAVLGPGGTLVVHDYTTRFPGVIAAVDKSGIDFRSPPGTSFCYAVKP